MEGTCQQLKKIEKIVISSSKDHLNKKYVEQLFLFCFGYI